MHEYGPVGSKTVDELLSGLRGEAQQIDDDVGVEVGKPPGERPGSILGVAVDRHPTYRLPGGVAAVRVSQPPAEGDDLVSFLDERGHEIAADVTRRADYDNPHESPPTECLPLIEVSCSRAR